VSRSYFLSENKDKTVTRSFRIKEEAFEALKEDADRKEITINTLVNQLFSAHKDFDRFFERMGMIKISTATFSLLLAATPPDRIPSVGRQAGMDVPNAIITAKDGVLSFQTVCGFLRTMSQYGNLFEYNEANSLDGKSKILTLMHRLGPNGSLFLVHYVKAIFEGIGLEPKIHSSEHSVTVNAEFPVK
jgi:hypothetical protein